MVMGRTQNLGEGGWRNFDILGEIKVKVSLQKRGLLSSNFPTLWRLSSLGDERMIRKRKIVNCFRGDESTGKFMK